MNLNQRAIGFYEMNRFEEALATFELALKQSRTVQSLNNLAWMYYHEEGKIEQAKALLHEALLMSPSSYFPYYLLGEIYIYERHWREAVSILSQGTQITSACEGFHNLGVAQYNMGEMREASVNFLKGSQSPSDYSLYCHVKCLIALNEYDEVAKKLDNFDEAHHEFVGEIELAEAYYVIGDYATAVAWFDKGWHKYYKSPEWVGAYYYALLKMNQAEEARRVLSLAMEDMREEITQYEKEQFDDEATKRDQDEAIRRLYHQLERYQLLQESDYIPPISFTPSEVSACYLFGCNRHQHSEYLG